MHEWARAQHGEDFLLADRFDGKAGGFFVEVGALDGEYLSNSYYFAKALDWTGILVEANPVQAELCRGNRPESQVAEYAAVAPGSPKVMTLDVVQGDEGFSTLGANRTYRRLLAERGLRTLGVEVRTRTLDDILSDADVRSIDFITVDVEGHELGVLRGFDLERWRPTVVLFESAGAFPDPRIVARLFKAGYGRTQRVVVNDWYEMAPFGLRVQWTLQAYLVSVPTFIRSVLRETLRAVGLLGFVRRVLRSRG